jgi:hypothetical protein
MYILLLNIFLILLVPSFFMVEFTTGSFATGFLIVSVALVPINFKMGSPIKISVFVACVIVFLIIICSGIINFILYNETKPIYSAVWIVCLIWSVSFYGVYVRCSFLDAKKSLMLIIILLLGLGWFGYFSDFRFENYTRFRGSVFPFQEASHYALALGLLSAAYSFVGNRLLVIFITINLVLLSLLLPSLTLMIFVSFSFLGLVSHFSKIFYTSIFVLSISYISELIHLLSNYSNHFSGRLDFVTTKNLSTLSYLQGWTLAYDNFLNTTGLGLGFQMLGGVTTELNEYSYTIVSIKGDSSFSNINDGSFIAAKLIAEFGVFGLTVILFYLIYLFRWIILCNRFVLQHKNTINISAKNELGKKILAHSLIFSCFVEMFVRGSGYFSPTLLLCIAMLIYTIYEKDKRQMRLPLKKT